jgi:hypothetical protein
MSLLTFKRKDPNGSVSVIESVRSINRLLERHYPDCTCSVLAAANSGMATEWVTIDLEITHESLACIDWYRKQAESRHLVLTDCKPRQGPALESDVTYAVLSPRIA